MRQLYGGMRGVFATCVCPTACEGICTSYPTLCNVTDGCPTGTITGPNTGNC